MQTKTTKDRDNQDDHDNDNDNNDDDSIYLLTNQAKEYIPANIRLISACLDEQESADVSNLNHVVPFTPVGTSGGACTSTLLEILYSLKKKKKDDDRNPSEQQQSPSSKSNPVGEFFTSIFQKGGSPQKQQKQQQRGIDDVGGGDGDGVGDNKKIKITYQELICQMSDVLKQRGYTQIPQLSTSHPMDINDVFSIVPSSTINTTRGTSTMTKRAIIIGINYRGMRGVELSGCHNDGQNMINYLKNECYFEDQNITILMDDDIHTAPTKSNILLAFEEITELSQPGDVVLLHFAGHGSKLKDRSGDEDDGFDETMIPLDYQTAGQIVDDDIFMTLIHPLKSGVYMTCIIDCCHSGTILDLPFTFRPTSSSASTSRLLCLKGKQRAFPHLAKVRRKKLWKEYKGLIVVGTAILWVAPIIVAWMMSPAGEHTNLQTNNQKV